MARNEKVLKECYKDYNFFDNKKLNIVYDFTETQTFRIVNREVKGLIHANIFKFYSVTSFGTCFFYSWLLHSPLDDWYITVFTASKLIFESDSMLDVGTVFFMEIF